MTSPIGALLPSVSILCATYNGAQHLRDQVDSFFCQTLPDWHVTFCDDGSSDGTLQIISELVQINTERFALRRNAHNLGFCDNFLRNLAHLPAANAYAFADQDDIWYSDKLARACAWLNDVDPTRPALYFARTEIVDNTLKRIGFSPLFEHPPAFRNALVQSIGGGNTIVFNEACRKLIVSTLPDTPVVSHDWWLYILVSGAGGAVHYDPCPALKYRQHGDNLVGANIGILDLLHRLGRAFCGQWRDWNRTHENAIKSIRSVLSEENNALFALFETVLNGSRSERMEALDAGDFFRQSRYQTRVMRAFVYMGRF